MFIFLQPPQAPWSVCTRVEESDVDQNNHTNNTAYVRFCWDALHAALREGVLPVGASHTANINLMVG